MSTSPVSTAVRDSVCETAIPIVRLRVDGVAVHVRGALSDEEILVHIDNVLKWNFDCPVALRATMHRSVVTLHGVVDWSYQRQVAERAVSRVVGVRSIVNEIRSRHTDS